MLQFDVMHSRYRENVAYRLRRYRNRDVTAHKGIVASQPVCDVSESIPDTGRA